MRAIPPSPRSGISLMEVLIAMFVLSIGLLGIAALIPAGGLAAREATRADHSAACGHGALDAIKTRGLLNAAWWPYDTSPLTSGSTFALDPLGAGGGSLGPISRLSYTNMPANMVQRIFIWHDDLALEVPDDDATRPVNPLGTQAPISHGRYTWFFTASPSPSEDEAAASDPAARKTFTVSAVACCRRDLTGGEEEVLTVSAWSAAGKFLKLGGSPDIGRDDWVLLCGTRTKEDEDGGSAAVGVWYRVVSAGRTGDSVGGNTSGSTYLTLHGPDWAYGNPTGAVYIPSVAGVYTTTVRLP